MATCHSASPASDGERRNSAGGCLAVPKTGAFGGDRRVYAGFLNDGGWGGNKILRELVQDADGWLGTRFLPEMIPACGEPFAIDIIARHDILDAEIDRFRSTSQSTGAAECRSAQAVSDA